MGLLKGSRNLWFTRAYFLLFYFGMGAVWPFINLYFSKRGLSGTEIGLIGTLTAALGLLTAPIWGRVSDNARNPRAWLQLAMIISGVANFLLSQQTIFLFIALFAGMDSLVTPGIDPLMSAHAMTVVNAESNAGFGSIRLWGSLGFAIAAPISGWFIETVGITSAFYIYAAGMALSALVLFLVSPPSIKPAGQPGTTEPPIKAVPMATVARGLLKNRELMGLILSSIVIWVTINGTKFEAVYLTQLGVQAGMIGWLNTVGAIIELPFMLLADRVLRGKGSAFTLKLSFWIGAIAILPILIFPSLGSFFVYRFLSGISFSIYVVSYTVFMVERAPAQQVATLLALYSITIAGIVNILFSPVSGMIFDQFGAYWLYVMAAVGYVVASVILQAMVKNRPANQQS